MISIYYKLLKFYRRQDAKFFALIISKCKNFVIMIRIRSKNTTYELNKINFNKTIVSWLLYKYIITKTQ